ncbi:hypothetical protein BKA81DRAFT_71376 [Phyllosticta paracitricarpa]|uniref:Uncharacterized protein n=2 Tax=Phyllosticta TaxID=121621 RepID=A0ABR1LBQ4_9PEZI
MVKVEIQTDAKQGATPQSGAGRHGMQWMMGPPTGDSRQGQREVLLRGLSCLHREQNKSRAVLQTPCTAARPRESHAACHCHAPSHVAARRGRCSKSGLPVRPCPPVCRRQVERSKCKVGVSDRRLAWHSGTWSTDRWSLEFSLSVFNSLPFPVCSSRRLTALASPSRSELVDELTQQLRIYDMNSWSDMSNMFLFCSFLSRLQ